ncbi:hypothetical protein RCC89_06015 [Cytophagaceae bacterium ABcell3]|nr:hypothetical protein RCC89_06015 [Cytophagaceae bacterium ABcell3]
MRKTVYVIIAALVCGLTFSCGTGSERDADPPDVGSAGTAGSEHKNGEVYEREGAEVDPDTVPGADADARIENQEEEEEDL